MNKATNYVAKEADESGFIHYSDEEHRTWQQLISQQMQCIRGKACDEYLVGLERLNLPVDRIPQLSEIDAVLETHTGWRTEPVPALIGFETFFSLLANKKFPVATFIRSPDEFEYLREPDIFHEIFGHCGMLTNQTFADFTQFYGKLGLKASKEERVYLARLYWFTVEFGLIKSDDGLKILGGGILSSPGETEYALEDKPQHKPMSLLDVFRTPYRIDIMQPIYFVLENMDQLRSITEQDLLGLVHQARELGMFEAQFPPKVKKAG